MTGYTSGKISRDPRPWRNIHHGSRWPDNWPNWNGLRYDPRPEYDNHNPILVEYRIEELRADWCSAARQWLANLEYTYFDAAPEQIAHARRVLTKLAELS